MEGDLNAAHEGQGARATSVNWARAWKLAPLLVSVITFFIVTGGRLLSPSNIRWLSEGDPATYYLGWHFFRNTAWTFPLGLNPRYGLEIGSSIMFADNVPLMAFTFKAISGWLPEPFQYFGVWLLACFALQAWFAWKLLGLWTREATLRVCGSALFVFAPAFLWRLSGHYAMLGQWAVLAGLYLCFGTRKTARGAAWPVLALIVSLVHSYTTAMVLGLWATDALRRLVFKGRTRADFLQLLLVPAAVVLGFWQAGFFAMGRGVNSAGFGIYRMNLASLVDASGWSYVLPDIPETAGDYEGFVYLGLGGILLALITLPAIKGVWPALRSRREYWPLLGLMLALTLFSISNRVALGRSEFVIPLPRSWVDRANLLRASGRMFWPVYYALFCVLLRALFKRYRPRTAAFLLAGVVLIQIVDTSAGWRPIRQALMRSGDTWGTPLQAAFWSQAANQYRAVRVVPPSNHPPGYEKIAYYAATHGMSTNAIYLARVDLDRLSASRRALLRAVRTGKYDQSSLYILNSSSANRARRRINPERDLLARIDGRWVLAPNWKCRAACGADPKKIPIDCAPDCRR